jgi:hypothetical protein
MYWEKIVKFIHTIFIVFILTAPFTNYELLLSYHFIIIPFLWMHWITNNDICALTVIESKITGKDMDSTYMASIINPIYQIKNKDFYIISAILFAITTYRLYSKYNFGLLRLSFGEVKKMVKKAIDKLPTPPNKIGSVLVD